MELVMVGGTWDSEGGRPSGYFHKLSGAINNIVRVPGQVHNGGDWEVLRDTLRDIATMTHVLWFVDIPNSFPKLLPGIIDSNPSLVLVQSKNNRKDLYTREQLVGRMADSGAQFLVEFTGTDVLLASIIHKDGTVLLDKQKDITIVADTLIRAWEA